MALARAAAAASGLEEKGSTIQLIAEKGPLSGQIFDFRLGSRIQIGRVVRGNSITIKDDGISSKHVLIQSRPNSHPETAPNCCDWTITDLASSNGTILNGAQLEPSKPCVLSDGDVVKIGELTSIRVKFEVTGREGEGIVGKTRRNPKRGAAGRGQRVLELVAIDEDSELGIEDKSGNRNNLRGMARNEKDASLENESGELRKNGVGNVCGRRTRGSNRVLVNSCEEMQNVGKVSSSTRSVQKEVNSGTLENDEKETAEEVEYVGKVKGKGRRSVSTRRTRSAKDEEKLEDSEDLDKIGNGPRSSRKEEHFVDTGLNLSVIEGRKTRKGTRGKKNLPLETLEEEKMVEELNWGHDLCEGEKGKLEEGGVNELVKDWTNLGREDDAGLASTSGMKGSSVKVDREEMVDMDKMKLGEWFDYLEVYLPKQIIDATEETISEMRHKAEKLHEFMLQQKNVNAKEKDGVTIG